MEAMTAQIIEWGVASLAMPGQSQSGDRYVVHPSPNGVMVAAIDGLGHGQEAARAADRAATILTKHAHESMIGLVKRCHDQLRETRGVVLSLAVINAVEGDLTWMGVGNVEGVVVRATASANPRQESLLLRGGVLGHQLPSLYASIIPIARGDMLILVTDGIHSNFADGLNVTDRPQLIADRIVAGYSKGSDDALVLVARYLN
jgi:negative regulator of sigma-B (phosphoserine phosphatase)